MIALISPAKRMNEGPAPDGLAHTLPQLMEDAARLMTTARRLTRPKIRALMGVNPALAAQNQARYQLLTPEVSPDNAKQAALLFNGDTYVGLEAAGFDAADMAFAQDHVRILSGLYGVLRPLDLIQPYRLEMGTRLSTRRGKDLYAFWGDRLTRVLRAELSDHEAPLVLNLASQEYFRAVPTRGLEVLEFSFFEERDGELKQISFFAKKARGMMARYVVKNRVTQPEALRSFDGAGYGFRPDLSSDTRWVYSRRSDAP